MWSFFFVVCDRFPFLQCGTNLFLVHVMNNITHSSMERDKCAHSHCFLIVQTQKIGISQVAISEDYTCDQMVICLFHPIPHPETHHHYNSTTITIKTRSWFSHYYLGFGTNFPGRIFYFNQFYQKTIPVWTFICISLYVTSNNPTFVDTVLSRATLVHHSYGLELPPRHVAPCQRKTTNFCLFLQFFQFLSRLAGANSAYCMTCLKIQKILFHFKDSMTFLPVYFWMI